MAPPGVQLLVAARADAVVPALVVGLGGIWAEALDDVAIVPLPADAERVEKAVLSLRGEPRPSPAAAAARRSISRWPPGSPSRSERSCSNPGSTCSSSTPWWSTPRAASPSTRSAADPPGGGGPASAKPEYRDSSPKADEHRDTATTIREHLARIERGDIARAEADYAEDAVLEAAPVGEARSVLTGTFHGREEIGHWMDGWFSSFESGSYRFKVEQSTENGERVYLALSLPPGAPRAAWRSRIGSTTSSRCATG